MALFGRRPPERGDGPVIPASKNLHISGMTSDQMSALVKVFGCWPLADDAAHYGGRRRKTSKGGNRDDGNVWGRRERYGDLNATAEAFGWRDRDRTGWSAVLARMSGLFGSSSATSHDEDRCMS